MSSYPAAPRPAWSLWLYWVLSSATGSSIGFVLGVCAACGLAAGSLNSGGTAAGSSDPILMARHLLILGIFTGLFMAVGQAIFLEGYLHLSPAWWVCITALGSGVGILVANLPYFVAGNPRHNEALALFLAAAGGAALGCSQWLVLRRANTHAVWWIPASALAWATGQLASFLAGNTWPISGSSDPLPSTGDIVKLLGYPLIIPSVAAALLGVVLARIIQADGRRLTSVHTHNPAQPPHSTSPS